MLKLFQKLVAKVQESRDEMIVSFLILLVLTLATAIAGIVYLNKKLDVHEQVLKDTGGILEELLTGKKPLLDVKIFDPSANQQLVPAALYYINKMKTLEQRIVNLEGMPTPSPTPTPDARFKIK